MATAYDRLDLVAASHKAMLEDEIQHAMDDMVSLSRDSRFTANAAGLIESFNQDTSDRLTVMQDFTAGRTSDDRLATADTQTPTAYGRRHLRLHEATRRLIEERHYGDILIVDNAGQIVYTAKKDRDFGQSAELASFSATALPKLLTHLKSASDDEIVFEDFLPYMPGEGRSGFIGIAIARRAGVAMGTAQPNMRVGYLLIRLSSDVVDHASSRRAGLGATGEIVVIGPDGLLRNRPALRPGIDAGSPAAALSIPGGELAGRIEYADGQGADTMAVAMPTRVLGQTWTIVASQERSEALADLNGLFWRLTISGLLAAVLAIGIALRSARALVRPIVALTQSLQLLARREWMDDIPGSDRDDEIGAIARAVVAIRDVTAEKANADAQKYRQSSEENRRLAYIDTLTQIENRRGFYAGVAALTTSGESGRGCAAMLMDLDGFKQINDNYGHAAGDRLLTEVASRLRTVLGPQALLARLGGDEFAAFLTDVAQPTLSVLAKTIIVEVSRDVSVDRFVNVNVGISIGLFCFDGSLVDIDEAMHNADLALYAAKSDGKSTFKFHSDTIQGEVRKRKLIEVELRRSVETGAGFSLHYQPIVDATTRIAKCREALLRWDCPGLGNVPPSDFLAIAEKSDLMGKIGRWVLTTACRDAATWADGCAVAVNVSPPEIGSGEIGRHILQALVDSSLNPRRLEIEITDTALLDQQSGWIANLRQIHALGVKVSLDDFGVGSSSLARLSAFPFDRIKIDGTLVRDAPLRSESAAIVSVVADLGNRLGIPVVAEGVETEAQFAFAKDCGCAEMQGFLIGHPQALAEIDNRADARHG